MTLEIIIIGIMVLMVVTLGYTTINLLLKNEKLEDIIISQNEFISKISQTINQSEERLKEIDQKGIFESDDEIGWFFKEIKNISSQLSQYKNN